MINFHCHTFFSDGVLSPSELLYRCKEKNYKVVGIADHVDESNFEFVIKNILKVTNEFTKKNILKAFCGVELTYVIPENISKIAKKCKKIGAEIVVVHGETVVEPVPQKTNYNAVISKYVDILAHPGLITEDEVNLAKKNNVLLEITSRNGHSITNGYIAKISEKLNAKLILSTDAHEPKDIIDLNFAEKVLKGCGLSEKKIIETLKNAKDLASLK